MGARLNSLLRQGWRFVRQLSGDDAYERYLDRHATCQAGIQPLSRKQYFQLQQQQKWSGIKRCC